MQEKYQTDYLGNTNAMIMSVFRYCQAFGIVAVGYFFIRNTNATSQNYVCLLGENLNNRIMVINIIMLVFIPINLFSAQVQRCYHVILILNYIYIALRCENNTRIGYGVVCGVCITLSLLWFGYTASEGAALAFQSHFTVGYLYRMMQFLFGS